jgi:hypothetical protein
MPTIRAFDRRTFFTLLMGYFLATFGTNTIATGTKSTAFIAPLSTTPALALALAAV